MGLPSKGKRHLIVSVDRDISTCQTDVSLYLASAKTYLVIGEKVFQSSISLKISQQLG